ncbi:MAG: hypothetical protein GY795_08225 [Desulfobacterales bacterium]|nr:hypothetical protein [Desulfobacterales bacterium]
MEDGRRERDLILAPNEYAYILDETKGNIVNYVGPHKTSLANTDQPVIFNDSSKRFERCTLETAIRRFAIAPEGWYIVLKNPAKDESSPKTGTANNLNELDIGKKVNIPGPVAFAPWPGQMVRVIPGHHLRSNQYLIVRVYDEEAARTNWKKAVIKPQTSMSDEPSEPEKPSTDSTEVKPDGDITDLTIGKLLVIKGTDVSFYIPPTGVEVVLDMNEQYIRDAVTLERLEYCVLLDEDGNKRYIRGPAVVFPRPTESFVKKNSSVKFKAIELNEISGLYVKVIAAYSEDGKEYKVGDELFITGKDQMIYFPRTEHAIIRYGEREIHYAVAIPAGEARYVLNRLTGQITLKRGPCMFLPDPRKEVITRRVIDPEFVKLWFPGNQEAFEYNRHLMQIAQTEKYGGFVREQEARKALVKKSEKAVKKESSEDTALKEFAGDGFTRRQSYTSPRTITLHTKYEGAIAIKVWTGYAVLVVNGAGERKVIAGPVTYLLEYDELLEVIELSTGTPKTDKNLKKTVYMRILHNKVSDIIEAETNDLCNVKVYLSYRINFEGEPEKWFDVENYVKFMTDHTRSLLRFAVKQYGIEEFYANAVSIIRDTILGTASEDGTRTGRLFEENGMRIYDVEVLDISIGDDKIEELLIQTQHTTVQQTLELATEKRELDVIRQKEIIKQKIAESESVTQQLMLKLEEEKIRKELSLNLAKVEYEAEIRKKNLDTKLADQEPLDKINKGELDRQKAKHDLELDVAQQRLAQRIEELRADVEAMVSKSNAVSPQLVAALQAFSDKALAEKMAESMAPLAILGGNSVAEVFSKLLQGTVLENVLRGTGEQVL